MPGIPLAEAAKHFQVHPCTVRRWIAQGCPCESLGEVGRGKGSLVNLEAVQRWRASKMGSPVGPRENAEILSLVAIALMDTIKRDFGHDRVNVKEGPASGLLALTYQRIWQNLTRQPLDEFMPPAEIAHLCAVYVESAETRHTTFRR